MDGFLSNDPDILILQKTFIKNGIQFILIHNFFEFEKDLFFFFFLQTRGTAMGTRFAPSYANLFMGHFESQIIQNQHAWVENIVLYKHYIDDLIFIWDGSETDFTNFTTHLNQNDYGITFSGKLHQTRSTT